MRSLFYTLLVLGIAACSRAQVSPVNPPFIITISPIDANVTAGDQVNVQLTIKNLTNQPTDLNAAFDDLTHMDSNFVFEVTDSHGNPVPKRTYPHSELRSGRAVFRTLQAGATMTEPQPVSRLFDMSIPGKYVIQASGPITGDTDARAVKSNKITVTVSAETAK
jgi:hypothetical protein